MINERKAGLFLKSSECERAGRAVVRALTHRVEIADVLDMPLAERVELDAKLEEIENAHKIGLETGDRRTIGTPT